MSSVKERNKEAIIFNRLCKDLYRNIQRRIIKKYIYPDKTKINSYNTINKIIKEGKEWKYCEAEENISEEEKILDIFKDNDFLSKVQKVYESLEKVIEYLDENEKNIQYLQKNIEIGEKKIELLSQLNTHLNNFFQKNEEISSMAKNMTSINNVNNNSNDINMCNTNENSLGHLNLVKSLNILNDLQIINSINDGNKQDNNLNQVNKNKGATTTTNTTITNNNNIILDNKIINNNIGTQKAKEKIDVINNEVEMQIPNTFDNNYEKNPIPKLLNKKSKRGKKDSLQYNNKYSNNHEYSNEKNYPYKKKYSNNNNKNMQNLQSIQNQNLTKDSLNNNNINISKQNLLNTPPENNINDNSNEINSNYAFDNPIELKENENDIKSPPQIDSNENIPSNDNINNSSMEIVCDKILKKAFPSLYTQSTLQNNHPIKEKIYQISNILKKISYIKFNMQDKFEDPYIIGSYSNFKLINLMDYQPPIDIMFKCKCIKSRDEIKNIAKDTMENKLYINYIDISFDYDKKNEMVKISNKCKIKLKNKNDFFIYINLFFVGVNLSSFINKENSIKRFFFSNNMLDNKGKILISLYFRRWRRKFKLFFIMPEFFDVIVHFYFNETETHILTIEKIFYDMFDGQINLENKTNNVNKDGDNIKEIKGYINEWYSNSEDMKMLKDAIITTQELIMKNEFYSTFNNDEE